MTADDDVRFDLDHEVAFRLLDGTSVPVRVTTVRVGHDVEVTGSVTLAVWERLFAAGAFHLDDEPPASGFETGRPVALRLRLRRPLAARLPDPDDLLRALVGDAPSAVQATEAWHALEAVQRLDVPGAPGEWVEIGLRTRFAEPVGGR